MRGIERERKRVREERRGIEGDQQVCIRVCCTQLVHVHIIYMLIFICTCKLYELNLYRGELDMCTVCMYCTSFMTIS